MQVKKTYRYGKHILRFTKTFFSRLSSSGDEVYDSFNYGHVQGILVSRSKQYFTITFSTGGIKPWLVYAPRYQDIIKVMTKRAVEAHFHIPVDFEGEPDFNPHEAHKHPGASAEVDGAAGNARFLGEVARSGKKVDMDDMYDVLAQGLTEIQQISQKQQEVLTLHTEELEEMQPQVQGLHGNIMKSQGRVKHIR